MLIRDDAMNSLVSRESMPPEGCNGVNREPKFQREKLDYNPPCPPKRLDSQDDLAMCRQTLKRALNHQTFKSLNETSRFQSLFGPEIAARISTGMSTRQPLDPLEEEMERKNFVSFAAPKFPMRKGSRDDLSTLPLSRTRISPDVSHSYKMSNKNIDLMLVVDEVLDVVNETRTMYKLTRTGSN